MNPKELSNLIGIDPKEIRKYARKHFTKENGGWDFNDSQVTKIKAHFNLQSQDIAPAIAPQVKADNWNTIAGLTRIANEFLQDNYGFELNIPIRFNSRLTRSLGRFRYLRSGHAHDIEIATKTPEYYGKDATIDVLKHELVHYACFTQGKPHGDGDWYFENELRRLGVTRTETYSRKGLVHQYTCTACGKVTSQRHRRINPLKYRSRCCNDHIKYEGQVELL